MWMLWCAYTTNLLFLQKVNIQVTERQHLTQKQNVSSSLSRICAEFVKFVFAKFFNVHTSMFCLVFYMIDFLNCTYLGGQGHRKKAAENASQNVFFLVFNVIFTYTL